MIKAAKATIQVRIDADLLDWLDDKARVDDRSRSWLINDFLRKACQLQGQQQPCREAS